MTNTQIIKFLDRELSKYNIKFDILQKRHRYKNKIWPGYIHILSFFELTNEQLNFISYEIEPVLDKNNWLNLVISPDTKTKKEILKEYFPIYEEINI